MYQSQHHEMRLEKTYASSAEEWFCPDCGRRFLMYWEPEYSKLVLHPGDVHVPHSGSKGGVRISPPEIA